MRNWKELTLEGLGLSGVDGCKVGARRGEGLRRGVAGATVKSECKLEINDMGL